MHSKQVEPASLARTLEEAWESGAPVEPLSSKHGLDRIEDAYAVQAAWNEDRLSRGERVIGRKIGLTSRRVQEQMGVNQPDFGVLWGSRYFPSHRGRAQVPNNLFLQPRAEGELAFLIGGPLRGPNVTLQDVLVATDAVAPAFEIVDSRIRDWRITIFDTIADNASYGGFAVGEWSRQALHQDLRLLGMIASKNGTAASEGTGSACLGHPAGAVAWLANTLSRFGIGLEPGDIVMSGALAPMIAVDAGDSLLLEMTGFPALSVQMA
jgi:2-keto-4-pentenoate hydratase